MECVATYDSLTKVSQWRAFGAPSLSEDRWEPLFEFLGPYDTVPVSTQGAKQLQSPNGQGCHENAMRACNSAIEGVPQPLGFPLTEVLDGNDTHIGVAEQLWQPLPVASPPAIEVRKDRFQCAERRGSYLSVRNDHGRAS